MPRRRVAVALALALLVVTVAVAGPPDTDRNLAPRVRYVTFWVGLAPVGLLLGPVWRAADPLRPAHRGLRAVLPAPPGCRPFGGTRPAPLQDPFPGADHYRAVTGATGVRYPDRAEGPLRDRCDLPER